MEEKAMTTVAEGEVRPSKSWRNMSLERLQVFAIAGIPEAIKELGQRYISGDKRRDR
jgi:hypothetical protein